MCPWKYLRPGEKATAAYASSGDCIGRQIASQRRPLNTAEKCVLPPTSGSSRLHQVDHSRPNMSHDSLRFSDKLFFNEVMAAASEVKTSEEFIFKCRYKTKRLAVHKQRISVSEV